MSWEPCQSWDDKKKICKYGKRECFDSHLDGKGVCDGLVFYEEKEENDYEYETEEEQ